MFRVFINNRVALAKVKPKFADRALASPAAFALTEKALRFLQSFFTFELLNFWVESFNLKHQAWCWPALWSHWYLLQANSSIKRIEQDMVFRTESFVLKANSFTISLHKSWPRKLHVEGGILIEINARTFGPEKERIWVKSFDTIPMEHIPVQGFQSEILTQDSLLPIQIESFDFIDAVPSQQTLNISKNLLLLLVKFSPWTSQLKLRSPKDALN